MMRLADNSAWGLSNPRESWQSQAACARHHDPDLWMVGEDYAQRRVALAVHICRNHCPVLGRCDKEAKARQGTAAADRSVVLGGVAYDARGRVAGVHTVVGFCGQCGSRDVVDCGPDHGTPAGYRTHRRRGEVPCTPCLEAMRVWDRQRKHKAKEAAA